MEYRHIVHPFGPIFNEESEILILGSLPSVKSREINFFYGHPQNRFWKMLSAVVGEDVPDTIDAKREMILRHHLALWDSIKECDIKGSRDSSIRNAVPNNINEIIKGSKIRKIICNGKSSGEVYRKYILPDTGIDAVVMPSTSPANAACTLEQLVYEWGKVIRDR